MSSGVVLNVPTIKRFFIVIAMAFAAFVLLAGTSEATVLRLEKNAHASESGDEGTSIPKPRLKPPSRKQVEPQKDEAATLLDLPFVDETGKQRTLREYEGKAILLNLWATWCAPCVKEMPALSKVANDYKDKGLVVVTLSQDDSIQQVKTFFSGLQIDNLPGFMDSGMRVFQTLKLRGLPVSILIDARGKEVIRLNGYVEWETPETRKMIESHLPESKDSSI